MKLTHNLRIFSRIQVSLMVRVFVILVIVVSSILVFGLPRHSQSNSGESTSTIMGAKDLNDSNLHLKEAIEHSQNFANNGQEGELAAALSEIQIALQLEPNNPYAAGLLSTLDEKNSHEIIDQISKTREILHIRPDYAAAWLRLSVLYQKTQEDELANQALETAKKLNLGW